jgi:ABC-type phosphate/phosphonate transport system substrate-binding protein
MQGTRILQLVLIVKQAIYVASNLSDRDRQIFVGAMALGSSSASLTLTAWKPTFENYLTETVGIKFDPHINFSLVPLTSTASAYQMAESGKVDFVYLSPSLYSCLESEYEGICI